MGGTATGTVDTTYQASWVVDSSPLRPVRASGGLSLSATAPASRSVGIVALINSSSSGSVAGTAVAAPSLGADSVHRNSYAQRTPSSTSTAAVVVAGSPAVLGMAWAGQVRQLERQLLTEPTFEAADPVEWESALAPYDTGVYPGRTLTGRTLVTDTGMDEIHAWHASTRNGIRPTLIVPVDDINDAWLVTFTYSASPVFYLDAAVRVANPGHLSRWWVDFTFTELPRVRW
jgi:hypothetical protein